MKPLLRALFAVVVTVGLSSCLEMKSTVTVNKDGTGTIEESALVSAQFRQIFQGLSGEAGAAAGLGGLDNPAAMLKGMVPDKKMAEKRAKELGEGVTVKSFEEVNSPDGKGGAKVVYAVSDFRKVKFVPFSALGGSSEPMTFAISGDMLTITNATVEDKKRGSETLPTPNLKMLPAFKPFLVGSRIGLDVKVAGGIASSDASYLDGDTLTYIDIQVDKFIDNPDAVAKFLTAAEQKMSNAQAAETFKDVEGIKFESKDVVTVKMK